MTATIGTPEQRRDPDFTAPPVTAIPLGIRHVMAMFVSNVTPAIIVAGAAGFGFGSDVATEESTDGMAGHPEDRVV